MGWLRKLRERRRKKRVPWEELQDLLSLDARQFEQAVAAIIRELGGRQVRVMGRSGDLSVDITFRDGDGKSVAVQCKRGLRGLTASAVCVTVIVDWVG